MESITMRQPDKVQRIPLWTLFFVPILFLIVSLWAMTANSNAQIRTMTEEHNAQLTKLTKECNARLAAQEAKSQKQK